MASHTDEKDKTVLLTNFERSHAEPRVIFGSEHEGSVQHSRMSKKRQVACWGTCAVVAVIIVILVVALSKGSEDPTLGNAQPWNEIRLPQTARPIHYDLTVDCNLEELTFDGKVAIELDFAQPTSFVTLHAQDMEVTSMAFTKGSRELEIQSHSMDADLAQLTLMFHEELNPGDEYTLHLEYTAELKDSLDGLYLSTYEASGEVKRLATTQFEPVSARKAFPCFDEPAMKATFNITLIGRSDLTLLSNMNQESEEIVDGKKVATFAQTPRMSTYLIAFIFSEFQATEAIMGGPNNETEVRVWTQPDDVEKGIFARDIAAQIITHYTGLFDIPYPLPKADLVAIPDFSAGAMENFGLITFRETAILIDDEESGTANYERVAIVVAHELAHQWFGNLVTMKWWNDLFLNEGFASWMEFEGVDAVFPEWDIRSHFLYDDISDAMNLDALSNSHPIEATVLDPRDIESLFDSISYGKGASLIEMISAAVHPGVYAGNRTIFFDGLSNYLKTHSYGNAESTDLWTALGEASDNVDVLSIMENWVLQKGYPVITLRRDSSSPETLTATQSYFVSSTFDEQPPDANESVVPQRWWVLLDYKTSDMDAPMQLDMGTAESVTLPYPQQDSASPYFKLNFGQTGFYRVDYPDDLLDEFEAILLRDPQAMSLVDRSGLLMDVFAFALASSNRTTPARAMEFAKFLREDSEYASWEMAASGMLSIGRRMQLQSCYGSFRTYVIQLMDKQLANVTWTFAEADAHNRKLLRSLLLTTAVRYGHSESLDTAKSIFNAWAFGTAEAPHPDIRRAVYSGAIMSATDDRPFDFLLNRLRQSKVQSERDVLVASLAMSSQPYQLQHLLDLALGDDIRSQDVSSLIGAVARNVHGVDLAWNFLTNHWDEFSTGSFGLSRIIQATTSSFTSESKRREIEEFFRVHDPRNAKAAVQQALEVVARNTFWVDTYAKDLCTWLSVNV